MKTQRVRKRLKKVKIASRMNRSSLTIVVIAFGLLGTFLLLRSLAAGPFESIEPESGTKSGNFALGSDTNASGGSFVKFGGGVTGTKVRFEAADASFGPTSGTTDPIRLESGLSYASPSPNGDVIAYFQHNGDYATFTVNVPAAGSYPVELGYAIAVQVVGQPASLKRSMVVNNGTAQIISFPQTTSVQYDWGNPAAYKSMSLGNITLNAGNNTITFKMDGTSDIYPWNVDYLDVTGATAPTTPPPTPTPPPGPPGTCNPNGAAGYTVPSGFPKREGTANFRSTLGVPSACLRYKYSSAILWNQPLPNTTAADLDPNSAGQAAATANLARGVGVGYSAYWENSGNAPSMYVVDGNNTPLTYMRYAGEGYCGLSPWLPGSVSEPVINNGINGKVGVPLPSGINITRNNAGSDSHLAVYDYVNDVMWSFWIFDSNQKTYCWGGVIKNASTGNNGTFAYPYGADTAGFTDFGSNVTMEDIATGAINHAVAISVQHVRGSGTEFSYPATRANAWCSSGNPMGAGSINNCLWVGQRLRLPANYNTAGISNPVTRMLAEAVKKYGFIIHDTGGGVGVQAESDLSVPGSNPWSTLGMGDLSGFPWESLQVLKKDYRW